MPICNAPSDTFQKCVLQPETLTAIPIFLTFDNRAASTGSRFSMIASCDRVSGFDAAASSLNTN